MTNPSPTPNQDELREQLAAIEHERWSDWQKWCHQVLREQLPKGYRKQLDIVLHRWEIQILTPYEKLSDKEKASDMEQVDRYWPLIQEFIDRTVAERLNKHLDNIEASIKQHTVPEGIGLVTRSYVINAIEFERTAAQQHQHVFTTAGGYDDYSCELCGKLKKEIDNEL